MDPYNYIHLKIFLSWHCRSTQTKCKPVQTLQTPLYAASTPASSTHWTGYRSTRRSSRWQLWHTICMRVRNTSHASVDHLVLDLCYCHCSCIEISPSTSPGAHQKQGKEWPELLPPGRSVCHGVCTPSALWEYPSCRHDRELSCHPGSIRRADKTGRRSCCGFPE